MNMKENYIQILKLMNVKVEEKTLRNNANKNTILFPFNSRKEYRARFNNEFYVVKKIHHEPCSYYSFGNKIQSQYNDYHHFSN